MKRPQCPKDFEERFIKSWPVIVQPKKDGVRCMTEPVGVRGWMKPRKKYELVEHKIHIQEKLARWFKGVTLPGDLDGELFIPNKHLQDTVSGVKGPKSKYHESLEYHLFDIMDETHICGERLALLSHWYYALPDTTKEFIKLVPHHLADNMGQLTELMDLYSKTDEGIIIRDPSERYVFDKRTRGCMRWKYFKDAEYPVYNIVDGTGKNVGISTFKCWDPTLGDKDCKKAQFSADSTGKREQRMKYFTDRDKIIGMEVTVTYQSLTKRGAPQFPKVKCVRNYE